MMKREIILGFLFLAGWLFLAGCSTSSFEDCLATCESLEANNHTGCYFSLGSTFCSKEEFRTNYDNTSVFQVTVDDS